ncbi:MAG: RNA-binding protein [Deltaproteobacteria bacterium]|nr:RNA-binding protein [Deltaproteobacteria bacterium]
MNNRLYVGNLSFNATTESLHSCFSEVGAVSDTHIVTDRESGRSRGFGFVTMSTDAEAAQAVARLDGSLLDGRAMRVNIAEPKRR